MGKFKEGRDIMIKDGALKSVGSARVYDVESILTVREEDLPENYIIENKPDVLNQDSVNSCVAHAIAECMQSDLMKNHKEDTDLSVLMIYGLWRNHDFDGMFPETTVNLGREKGTTLRSLAPGNVEVPEAIKKAEEYKKEYPDSLGFKVGNYFKFKKDEDFAKNIKRALYEFNLPIMFVWKYASLGRHAEIVIGWSEEGKAICQNSWGEDFGEDGIHEIDFGEMQEAYLIFMDKVKLPFSDVSGHWAEKYIRNLYFAGIMEGYPDGTFAPDKAVTRAELAKVVDEVLKDIDEKIRKLDKEA